MLSTKTIKRKIKSAKNIAKVTQAMEMVAASKMTKAQASALSGRPYAQSLLAVTQHLTGSDRDASASLLSNSKGTGEELTIIVAPEKGLCGGLITSLERLVGNRNGLFISVGTKARQIVLRAQRKLYADFTLGLNQPIYLTALPIVQLVSDGFRQGKISKVTVIYTHFINTLKQTALEKVIIPVETPAESKAGKEAFAQYIFEPSVEELLEDVLKHYLEVQFYQILLEAYASEQSARMVSMKNATDNADGIIDELTLFYNKARQQEITSEIADLVKIESR